MERWLLIHSQIIPVGGNHFTNDLAVGFKVPHAEAERIKINHGSVISSKSSENSHITIQGMQGSKSREVSSKLISEILAARADELFDLIKEILVEKELGDLITAGDYFNWWRGINLWDARTGGVQL